jgi:hypothetical protein
MAKKEIKLTGTVVTGSFGKGSKSAHEGIHLKTEDGTYLLRRKGGNPFFDEALQKLEGKTITATGVIKDYLFEARDLEESDEGTA